ncbi:hypothetical protein O5511_03710 [Escherichia coli]|nr:hypothetical protein [Escherichia coli]
MIYQATCQRVRAEINDLYPLPTAAISKSRLKKVTVHNVALSSLILVTA